MRLGSERLAVVAAHKRVRDAGPDLLAALREATDFVDDAIKQWPVGSLELENARVVRKHIDAAIVKATGSRGAA